MIRCGSAKAMLGLFGAVKFLGECWTWVVLVLVAEHNRLRNQEATYRMLMRNPLELRARIDIRKTEPGIEVIGEIASDQIKKIPVGL